jgi:predicted phage terminase large subunit-like protein
MIPLQLAAIEYHLRERVRSSFLAWCEHALEPFGQSPARHHRLIIRELEALTRGDTDRLMLFLPPGSAKTTYATKLFPPWFLAQRPGQRVICASASAKRAEQFSYDAQRFVSGNETILGYSLIKESVQHWITTNDGEYVAAGAGAQITGVRADLMIMDDVVAGRDAADSPVERENIWSWWQGDVIGRLKPGAKVILIMTRWHGDDFASRLLKSPSGDRWKVVRLPAIAELHDPLGRAPGEALWPEWEGLPLLERKRQETSSREWASQFQQRPVVDEGAILKADWWRPWTDPLPSKPDFIMISVDTAYTTKEQNDYSACTVWLMLSPELVARPGAAFDPDQFRARILLRGGWQERLEFPELVEKLLATAKAAAVPGVPMRVLVEGKASGLSVIQELRRRAPSLNVWQTNPRGDKVARAHSVTSLLEGGKVWALATKNGDEPRFKPFAQTVIDECAQFPLGEHDDLPDSVTMALRHLRDSGAEYFSEDSSPDSDDQYEALLLY